MGDTRAMVLAAGFGTRLRPLTERLPKPLVPVVNRPLITYTLRLLARAGVTEVAINLHHLEETVPRMLGSSPVGEGELAITYSREKEILGTGGGVVRMRSFLENGTFLLLNGDVLTGVDLQALFSHHQERAAAATMVVRPLPEDATYTPLYMDEEGWLVGFKGAKRKARGEVREVMFCGIHALDPVVFDFLPAEGFSCINNQAYTAMIEKGLNVAAYLDKGPWYDLGTPATYWQANLDLVSGSIRLPQAQVEMPDGVLVGPNVEMGQGVKLGPDVIVGEGSKLGDGVELARCVIWPGSSVADRTHVHHAVITPDEVISIERNGKGF